MLRRWVIGAAVMAALFGMGAAAARVAALAQQSDEQRVSFVLMKFDYLPDTVTVKKGKPVVLELSTLDRVHGFDAPSLNLHAEVPPGAPTILRFTPEKAGTYGVHCDIFCGSGHEDMGGRIIVTE